MKTSGKGLDTRFWGMKKRKSSWLRMSRVDVFTLTHNTTQHTQHESQLSLYSQECCYDILSTQFPVPWVTNGLLTHVCLLIHSSSPKTYFRFLPPFAEQESRPKPSIHTKRERERERGVYVCMYLTYGHYSLSDYRSKYETLCGKSLCTLSLSLLPAPVVDNMSTAKVLLFFQLLYSFISCLENSDSHFLPFGTLHVPFPTTSFLSLSFPPHTSW